MTDRERVLAVVDACYAALHGRVGRTPCVPCLMRLIEDEREACAKEAAGYQLQPGDPWDNDAIAAAILARGGEHASA